MVAVLAVMNWVSHPRHLLRIVLPVVMKNCRVSPSSINVAQLKVAIYLQAATIILSSSMTPTTAICGT